MIPDRLTTRESQRLADERRDRYWEHRDYPSGTVDTEVDDDV